tara:strand:+ start:143 stop:634 length:492 start_codon:yes stop_codon:yes gene_type:complete
MLLTQQVVLEEEQVTKVEREEQVIHLPQVPLKVLLEEVIQAQVQEIMEVLVVVELQKQVKLLQLEKLLHQEQEVVQVHQILLQVQVYHMLVVEVGVVMLHVLAQGVLVEQEVQVEMPQVQEQLELQTEVVVVEVVIQDLMVVVKGDQESLLFNFLQLKFLQYL